jgi:ethanolamine-phosphate cytidylyltransferase
MKEAKAQGDYLICGLHTDDDIKNYDGFTPLVTLQERVLAVLQCRYADEVIVGAPVRITAALLDQFRVNVVVHGKTTIMTDILGFNPYEEAITRGIFTRIESHSDITAKKIVRTILDDKARFQERNRKKSAKEIRVMAAQKDRDEKAAAADTAAATSASASAAAE